MRALALTIMLLPSVVLAQAPGPMPIAPADEPSECVTTTTTRCTGAAAPYAVQPVQPQMIAPAPPPPPQVIILDPRKLAGDGWKLEQTPDGCFWRTRKTSTDAPAVWGTGLAFWLGGYAAGIIGGMEQGGVNMFGWWPIIGAFANAAFNSGNTGAQTLWAVDGLAQAGGFVTFLVGLAAGPDKIERQPIHLGAASFVGGGSGIALAGRF